jgi:hypothetical protein
MRGWMLVVAGLVVVVIAGVWGVRLLRVDPLPAKDQDVSRSTIPKPGFSVLSASEVDVFVKDYLMDTGGKAQSWQLSKTDLDTLEDNLLQISYLRENAPGSDRHIDHPNLYFRQYLPIVLSGKKQIFVNAFCRVERGQSDDWRYHLQIVVDGGDCFWQVWYDPATQKFSNLMINGVA